MEREHVLGNLVLAEPTSIPVGFMHRKTAYGMTKNGVCITKYGEDVQRPGELGDHAWSLTGETRARKIRTRLECDSAMRDMSPNWESIGMYKYWRGKCVLWRRVYQVFRTPQ